MVSVWNRKQGTEKHTKMHWFDLENIPDTLTKNTAHAINLYKKWEMKNRQQ